MKASPRARGRKAKEKVVGTYLGVQVVVLVVEVEEKQKAKARKDVEEATTKEESQRARKERATMVRKVKQQVTINAKSVLAMVTGVESAHNAWM